MAVYDLPTFIIDTPKESVFETDLDLPRMELDTVHMAHELIGIGGTVDHEREEDSWALSEIEGLVDES